VLYTFGTFEFDDHSTELRKNGRITALEPQPAKALALLLARTTEGGGDRADGIVTREELRDAVWGKDTHVDFDRGLAYCISQVRSALGDSGENPRFVQTIPRRGFKFIAPVAIVPPIAPVAAVAPVLQFPPPHPPRPKRSLPVAILGIVLLIAVVWAQYALGPPWAERSQMEPQPVVIGVSIFDNETGLPEHDRMVSGLSDLVVTRLTELDRERVAVIGNAAILRQPRNIRNLQAVKSSLKADYVLLGQLQLGESGLRFITHFIRLRDEAHLKANRLVMKDGGVGGLEAAVVEEFERAVREHVLNPSSN